MQLSLSGSFLDFSFEWTEVVVINSRCWITILYVSGNLAYCVVLLPHKGDWSVWALSIMLKTVLFYNIQSSYIKHV